METPASGSASDLAAYADKPFDLLWALENRLRAARLDLAAGLTQSWTGLAFRLRGQWLLAPREDIREVIQLPRMTAVPGARPWLLGIANVRGGLLPVTDLGLLLGEAPVPEQRDQRVLVYQSERAPAGLLVDEVIGYRQFAPSDQRHELTAGSGALEPYVLGAFSREGRTWLAFSVHKLVRSAVFTAAGA
jgi:twitching motility protein PilI